MQGMDHTAIESLLQAVARGDIPPEQALRHLGDATAADSLQGLHLDHERALRTGLGEVVFAQGKTDGALVGAVRGLSLRGAPFGSAGGPVATRIPRRTLLGAMPSFLSGR